MWGTGCVCSEPLERLSRWRRWLKTNERLEHQPSAVNLCAEVDLEVLGVVKDVQESAALVKLGDAEEMVQKLESSKILIWNKLGLIPKRQEPSGEKQRSFSGMLG